MRNCRIMKAAKGENSPACDSASSEGSIAARKVVTISHTNMPAMMPVRTIVARRRSTSHAPTV